MSLKSQEAITLPSVGGAEGQLKMIEIDKLERELYLTEIRLLTRGHCSAHADVSELKSTNPVELGPKPAGMWQQ